MIKETIIRSFSKSAASYTEHAAVQLQSAQLLADFLSRRKNHADRGPILEIGCGTGIFTEHLLQVYPDRQITVSDASQEMLNQCIANLENTQPKNVVFKIIDAEKIDSEEFYDLIVASFTLQWVTDLSGTIELLCHRLRRDGQIFFSLPVRGSFQEWQQMCRESDTPFSANELPCQSQLSSWCDQHHYSLEAQTHKIICKYDNALDFFRALKSMGAAVNTKGERLSLHDLNCLVEYWDSHCPHGVQITYLVMIGRISKGNRS